MEHTHLTPKQVAERLQVRVRLLERWRTHRTGPPFVKVGHLIRYPIEGLEKWLAEKTLG